jgi:hypothetical protein
MPTTLEAATTRALRPSTTETAREFVRALRLMDSRRIDEIAAVLMIVADQAETMREIQRSHRQDRSGCLLEVMDAEKELDDALAIYRNLARGHG